MNTSVPQVPVFRSIAQERILSALFERTGIELSIGDLAQKTGLPQPTVSKEVDRLIPSRTVLARRLGRARLVSGNWSLPWAEHLAAILAQTVGVRARIGRALAEVAGIERAFLFGSWAARHLGQPGPAPNDVDVLVVGDVEWLPVHEALKPLEAEVGSEINVTIVPAESWDVPSDDPFLSTVIDRPLVELDLPQETEHA